MTPDEYRALAKEYFARAAAVLADDEEVHRLGTNHIRTFVEAGALALQLAEVG